MAEPGTPEQESSPDPGVALIRAMDQMRLHSEQLTGLTHELTDFVANLHARVRGTEAVAAVVDENETQAEVDRKVAAGKELIAFTFEKMHQYVTIVVGGAYIAYFTTLSTMAQRFTDNELRISAALMTVSVTVFALWEVLNVTYIGAMSMKGNLEGMAQVPKWQKVGWPIALAISLLTALPAIGISIHAYVVGLIG